MKKYTPPKIEFVKIEDETSVAMAITKSAKTLSEALSGSANACFPGIDGIQDGQFNELPPPLQEELLLTSGIDWDAS